ncbi:MAG: anaerobic ribonucleoside-triphosphate reductase activating protein [Flavobacteriaceae bacterium]
MFFYDFQIALQEVPGEISLCFSIAGCKIHCDGCHSPFLWKEENGELLTNRNFDKLLNQYQNFASCVLFMGGEWHEKELIQFLKSAKEKKYKTCLYTGEETVSNEVLTELTFIKTGKWLQKLGGLDSPTTNQKFKELSTNKILNHQFIKN